MKIGSRMGSKASWFDIVFLSFVLSGLICILIVLAAGLFGLIT